MKFDGELHWSERVASSLVHSAARRTPGDLSVRLEEEWRAALAQIPQPLARLRFALGCCWATSVIVRERQTPAAQVATGPATPHGMVLAYDYLTERGISRRTLAFVAVASLHVGVFYAFMAGLTLPHIVTPPYAPLEPRMIDDLPLPPVKLTVDKPRVDSTSVDYPRPDLPVIDSYQPEPWPLPTTHESDQGPPVAGNVVPLPSTVEPVHPRHAGGPGAGFPSTGDYYPSASIHLGEQGLVTVQACVDAKGRLTAEPALVQSSGSRRLDEAALRLAKAGSGHYRATTENGQPVVSCYPFAIRFNLN